MKNKIITYLKFTLVLGLVVFLYGFANGRNSQRKLEDINVVFSSGDNPFVTTKMIKNIMKRNGVSLNQSIASDLDLHHLEQRIKDLSYIKNISISVNIKGVIKVNITQRRAIARVINSNGFSYYLSEDGIDMPLSREYSPRVILVTGVEDYKELDRAYSMIKHIDSDEFFTKEITGISHIGKGEYRLNSRINNIVIDLGSLEGFGGKLKKMKAFYLKAIEDKSIYKYKKINLKYNNQVVCSK